MKKKDEFEIRYTKVKSLADNIQALTLGSEFSFREFIAWVRLSEDESKKRLVELDNFGFIMKAKQKVVPINSGGNDAWFKIIPVLERKTMIASRKVHALNNLKNMQSYVKHLTKLIEKCE